MAFTFPTPLIKDRSGLPEKFRHVRGREYVLAKRYFRFSGLACATNNFKRFDVSVLAQNIWDEVGSGRELDDLLGHFRIARVLRASRPCAKLGSQLRAN